MDGVFKAKIQTVEDIYEKADIDAEDQPERDPQKGQ